MITIDKVGLELELANPDMNYHGVGSMYGVPVARHRRSPTYDKWIKGLDVNFGMTEEYYSNQIEFNIGWDNTNLNAVKDFYTWLYKKGDPYMVTHQSPGYVGTHIHFLLKVGPTPIEFRLRRKKYIVFHKLLKYYIGLYSKLLSTAKSDAMIYALTEDLNRLIANHNVNIYRDKKYFAGELGTIRRKLTGLKYYYTNGENKPKYQPMLWAKPTPGKPLSFEVRWIPNTVALNPVRLKSVVNKVHEAFNTKGSKIINIKTAITNDRVKLCKLYNRGKNKLEASGYGGGTILLNDYYSEIKAMKSKS